MVDKTAGALAQPSGIKNVIAVVVFFTATNLFKKTEKRKKLVSFKNVFDEGNEKLLSLNLNLEDTSF